MSFPARKIWNKLSRMSWNEFRTRIEQALGKRTEYGLYRLGLQPQPRLRTRTADQGSHFFFSHREIPARLEMIRQYLPDAEPAAVKEADEIVQHRFRLLGYRDLDYGAEIDWHLDAVHGKRAPLDAWYKINFLDFEEVGDHKVTWELNRHQHLVTLAKAWAFTGHEKYAEEIARQFYSWQRANPFPVGINWGSSLEVAFRSLSWIWVRNLLGGGSRNSGAFDRDLALQLERHGHYIEQYLSTYFSPNTHLIGEALALFFIGTTCPEIPAARRWQIEGLKILVEEIQRQVRPDGVYFEQSLYYHVYALDMFLHTRALAAANEISVPDSYDHGLRQMLHVLDTLCRNGAPEGFGDDDGGRLFNPRRNRAEHMADSLVVGLSLLESISLPSARLTEEAIWLFGEKAIARWNQRGDAHNLSSCAFEDGGLYVISSSGERRTQMVVDSGPHGIGHGGHGHADALSVSLSIDGQPFLIDPGSYVYISPGKDRNQFRGTAAHNTVRVDQLDQAVPETPFSWSSLPEVAAERWERGGCFTLFAGSHTGYRRLSDPVLHERTVFHVHGEYWLVRDVLTGHAAHELEVYWHFAPEVGLAVDSLLNAIGGSQRLTIMSAGSAAWDTCMEEGFVSPAYGEKLPGPVGVFKSRQQLPAEHCSLIVPTPVSAAHGEFRVESVAERVAVYKYEHSNVEDRFIFGKTGQSWVLHSIASDAEFLFLRVENREVSVLVFCEASFLEIAGQRIFSAAAKVRRLEWTATAGATASDPESLKFFHGGFIRGGTPVR